ncbi:MAG TPA: hypothetical protein VIN65_10350 [Candidatus Dormibacteraeota bacterium]|jgi:hypothetical protein
MATPIDLLDSPARMSYGGLVDPSTVEGQVDEEADWCGAVAALLTASVARDQSEVRSPGGSRPAGRLAHITSRRGTYSPRVRR